MIFRELLILGVLIVSRILVLGEAHVWIGRFTRSLNVDAYLGSLR